MPDNRRRRARVGLLVAGVLAIGTIGGGVVVAVLALNGSSDGPSTARPPTVSDRKGPDRAGGPMTPARAKPLQLVAPSGQRDGASTGFPHDSIGAISAAVYRHEELAFLDDAMARRQLEATTSASSPASVDAAVSQVRSLREAAGLPPSGGTPPGLTVRTYVDAVRGRSLVASGDVVQVWMHYSRYAQLPDGSLDQEPLRDQTDDVLLAWEDGDWKITTEPRYRKLRTWPVAYEPDSPYAWRDGWWQVQRAD